MKSAKEILESLGFNAQSPSSTQRAFLQHLEKAAQQNYKAEVIEPEFGQKPKYPSPNSELQQLSFDSKLLGSMEKKLKFGS